jgi:hypothetical protein
VPDRQRPSDEDVPGTRYFRDSDGEIVVDRREEKNVARTIILWIALGLVFLTAVAAIATAIKTNKDSGKLENTIDDLSELVDEQAELVEQQVHDSAKADYNFRLSQRVACEGSNDLRAGLRGMVRDQIDSARSTPPELFPQIPPDEFARLIEERVEELQQIVRVNFRDVDCKKRYPLLDNPDTEADERGT